MTSPVEVIPETRVPDDLSGERLRVENVTRPYHLLPLSARTPEALRELASRYARWLDTHPEAPLADICYTAGVGRSHLEQRAGLVVDSRERTQDLLRALADDQP